MKHRSVIAFAIVVAALFAAPQLSHDLENFKSALGARLRGELMHVLLSLPAGGGTPSAVAPRPAETLLASCTKAKSAAKSRKVETVAPSRAGVRAAEPAGVELAMIAEPLRVLEPWSTAFPEGSPEGAALPRRPEGSVAMIIPPDSGIDPRGRARASESATSENARQARKLASDVRMSYVAAHLDGKGAAEWRKADEALRRLGSYEFRVVRDGVKTKVLKVDRTDGACCPRPAPRAPRPAGVDAAPLPLSAVGALDAFVSE
jgi:hypothetical protein